LCRIAAAGAARRILFSGARSAGHLKIHSVPIPRLGGVAMMLAIVMASCLQLRLALHLVHFYFALG
jgi:UDP-N-acetylmuramyl pentapeptide phosphotransferase/UDP-N-acetylglucosamine-1-phosphate transferase